MEVITGGDLGVLITLHKKMRASGRQLTLFNLNVHVCEIFAITKLNTVFDISRANAHQFLPTHV